MDEAGYAALRGEPGVSALEELAELEDHGAFIARHVAPTADEIAEMLRVVGAASLEDLAARTLPAAIAGADLSALPKPADRGRGAGRAARA